MKLFRKLFFSYVLVSLLALVISGGFAGWLVFQATGRTQARQLRAYGQDMAQLLQDKDWTPDDLKRVQSRADTLDKSEQALIWVVDREGLVRLASPSAVGERGRRLTDEELNAVLAGRTVVGRPRPHGMVADPVVAVPILQGGEVAGAILLSPNLDAAQQARRDILSFILYGAGAAALAVAAISFYISQRIAHPVAKVSEAAKRVAQGDFSSRVEWESADEIGQLTRSFNEMAAELERLEAARRDLVATVSHELKGPLARISGFLEAVHDGVGGQEAKRRHFDIARREVGRLTRLVNDLLDFSRLEAGRLKLHLIPCDLAPYLVRAAEVFEAPAAAGGIHLEAVVPGVLPIVECEPERVEQAVANLLENALAFTPSGGKVTLTARDDGQHLVVEVQDTGAGIPAADLEQVWERFYKLDRARTPGSLGFGLGLTIVKQLVELQGGQVFASSEPGAGSCFGFWLPKASPA